MTFASLARNLSFFGAGFALLATATPALPQDGNDEARLRRLEAEVRALQRTVFPGGDGRFFEPEISAQPATRPSTTGASTTAVTDILARRDPLEAQLQRQTMFVEQHPDHWRTTYGRNLLGRAYLDDGKAKEAAPWFLKNYQEDKTGARAGDSLLYLAEAMIALDDTRRACIALAEFSETYPALAAGRLQGQYEANRAKVTCD